MEGSEIKPEAVAKGGMNIKLIAIIVVAVLVVAAVGAVLLMGGENEPEPAADNWLDKGFKIEVFYNIGHTIRQMACEQLKQGLESINPGKIVVTVTGLEWSQIFNLMRDNALPAWAIGWVPDYADPHNYVQPFYRTGGNYPNTFGYSNSTLDAMIDNAASELNETTRAQMYHDIEYAMYDEATYIWANQATNFHVERDWVDGYYFNPMFSGMYYYDISKTSAAPDPYNFTALSTVGDPVTLDPAWDYETNGGEVIQNVYETLLWYDGNTTKLIPQLAKEVPNLENGGISADGLQYTYTLRNDVTFHDGTPMTAEDVKFSIERTLRYNDPHGPVWMIGDVMIPNYYYDYGAGSFNSEGELIGGVNDSTVLDAAVWAKNDTTIIFNLTTPFPAFTAAMTFGVGSVISKDYVMAHGGLTHDGFDYMNDHMCGTGPFMLRSWTVGSSIVMERNDNYWNDTAFFENVVLQQVPDYNSRKTMFMAGDGDWCFVPRLNKQDVEHQEGITVIQGIPTFDVEMIGLNWDINVNSTYLDPTKTTIPSDFFTDINVRLAFMHAFNYEAYITNGLKNTAIRPNGAIPKDMFGYPEDIPLYDFNLTKAADYLKAAKLPAGSVGMESQMGIVNVQARIR